MRQQLEDKSAEQDLLFHRIPLTDDTQACWLLLLMCAATRANFWLRAVHPDQSESFAVRHDTNVWRCMRAVLGVEGVSGTAQEVSQLPFSLGGLSLTSAVRSRVAAFWSSGADCIHMVEQRHPEVVDCGHRSRPFPMFRSSEELPKTVGNCWVGHSTVEGPG